LGSRDHENISGWLDREADHLARNREESWSNEPISTHRPLDEAGTSSRPALILDQLEMMRLPPRYSLGENDVLAGCDEPDLRRPSLRLVILEARTGKIGAGAHEAVAMVGGAGLMP